MRTLVAVAALVVLLVWLTSSGAGLVSPPAKVRVTVILPRVALTGTVTAAVAGAGAGTTGGGSPGTAGPPGPALPWPTTGQAAVDVPATGYRAQSGPERPVPVASMTKVMTAYLILADHPLAVGQQGPSVTMTAADAQQFGTDTVTDQANVILEAGEVLTEHQMLEGLLVHSANDLAYALASWDAGTVQAFVAKMNATAASLGMHDTHFADSSGFLPASVSTASDLLTVAAAAMTDPVFAQIVAMPAVTLPLAGTVGSYTPLLGTTGVVGIKSGFTDAAGGGDLLAYRTSVDGHTLVSLAAVTSQQGWTVLGLAGREALGLAKASATGIRAVTVLPAGTAVARVSDGSRSVDATTAAPVSVLAGPGDRVHQAVHVRAPSAGAARGTQIGTATVVLAGQRITVPVRLAARLG